MLALVKSRGILPLGAEHTFSSGLPLPRESGFSYRLALASRVASSLYKTLRGKAGGLT